jgi:hypothetical protein
VQLNLSDSAVGQTLTAVSSLLGDERAVFHRQGRFRPRERWRLRNDAAYTGIAASVDMDASVARTRVALTHCEVTKKGRPNLAA